MYYTGIAVYTGTSYKIGLYYGYEFIRIYLIVITRFDLEYPGTQLFVFNYFLNININKNIRENFVIKYYSTRVTHCTVHEVYT